MSSEADILAFQNSVEDNLDAASTALFNGKKWTYITDSTSNSGQFGSGQIQFDLKNLSSQSQWIDLREATVEFPVKITAEITSSVASAQATGRIHAAIIKNGWHQWISSAQLMINGQTIQSAQPYENVAAQWRILSTWSQDELVKQGPTCGFSLDDMTGDSDTSGSVIIGNGLANCTFGTFNTGPKGFDCLNNAAAAYDNTLVNKGAIDRALFTNNSVTLATNQASVLAPTNMKLAGRSNVAATSTTLSTPGTFWSAFYMATVRLRDLCDLRDFPMCKNLQGYLYLNFNSASTTLSVGSATAGVITTVATQITSGQTCPFLVNNNVTNGFTTTVGANTVVFTGLVDGTTTKAIGESGPVLTSARLLAPYYMANPKADAVLSQTNKFFTTLEKIQFTFDVAGGTAQNYTVTSGVSNPKRIVMLPLLKQLGGSNITAPEQSPFDPAPATSGNFATMSQLQIYVANQPIYQTPVQYDYEQFLSEQSQVGLNGNQSNEETSGLLTEQLWTQNHRFYTTDLSRRMDAEDGSSKSVSVSYTNTNVFGHRVIGHLYYEKRWVMDTTTCTISPL
jgi:hypothetical protein